MKKIIIALIFTVHCYTMEPESYPSRILCTHDSIHRDLLVEHTVKCGLEPEMARIWNEWKEIPLTIQKSICKSYYDTQYQIYKDGCAKKNWPEGSIPSLLKFIGTPFDANTPYDNVPAIENVRTIMPQICFLKKMASVIPFELQENLINPLLDGIPYVIQHQMSTIQPLVCSTEKNKNNKVSALVCNQNSIFAGFYNGEIQKWDYKQSRSEPTYSYQAHSMAVNALLATETYLISGAECIKVRMQENGMVYRVISTEKPIRFLSLMNKELLASAHYDNTISVWNFKKGLINYGYTLPVLDIESLSCFNNLIIASGKRDLFNQKNSIVILNKNMHLKLEYFNYCNYIDSIHYYGEGHLAICGADGICFSAINQNYELKHLASFCAKDSICSHFTDLGKIAVYTQTVFRNNYTFYTKYLIKTFNLISTQNGYLSHTFQCNSNPTQLTPFQDGFVSGHSNGDIIVWKPNELFETWYKKNTASQVALLQYAYQQTIHPKDSENNSLCSIQ